MNSAFAHARKVGIKTIRLAIYQPKQGGMSEWSCTLDDLESFAALVRSKACSVENAARDYGKVDTETWSRTYLNQNPNEVECAFCRAKPTCPSANRKVQETIGADFAVVSEMPAGEYPDFTEPHHMPSDDLGRKMAATGFIEDWIKAVRAEVERRLLAGEEVPGFGLDTGRQGPRKWSDDEDAETTLRRKMRLKVEDVYNLVLKSPTQLERLARPAKTDDGSDVPPVLGPKQWKKLESLVTRSDPKPTVRPVDQIKNPYVVPKPSADDFAPVAAEDDLF